MGPPQPGRRAFTDDNPNGLNARRLKPADRQDRGTSGRTVGERVACLYKQYVAGPTPAVAVDPGCGPGQQCGARCRDERAWEAWRTEVAFAERFTIDAADLDVAGDDGWRGTVPLRWALIHMVEEYARHNGHADLLRERIDGSIGL